MRTLILIMLLVKSYELNATEYDWEYWENKRHQRATRELLYEQNEAIREQTADLLPTAGLVSDLVFAALSEVDWLEIAENYLEEVEQDAA